MSTTDTRTQPAWSVDVFAAFWDNPDPRLIPAMLTEDVVGIWPGGEEVYGPEAYTERLAQVLDMIPGMRLEVAEHATNGEFTFVRWIMLASGADGPFEMTGIDRIRLRDGLVCENVIRFDRQELQALLSGS